MSICAAHCSWVCCSRSTSRMTSYSSSVSRIGSVFSHPLGQNLSTCGASQIRRHRGGLGMDTPPLFPVYTDYNALNRKKQYRFFKSRCNFRTESIFSYVIIASNASVYTNARNHPFCFRGTDGFLLVEALPQAPVNAVFQTAAARFFESLMEKYRVGKPVQHLKNRLHF